jgi:hypothetical protein
MYEWCECDCCNDGKLLNIGKRFLLEAVDLRIFCYIFVYSSCKTERKNRTHAID